jgi:hypothetical protein
LEPEYAEVLVIFDASAIGLVRTLHEHDVRFVIFRSSTEDDVLTIVYENAKSNVEALARAMHKVRALVAARNASLSVAARMIQNSSIIRVIAAGKRWSLARAINGEDYESLIARADSVVVAPPFHTSVATI